MTEAQQHSPAPAAIPESRLSLFELASGRYVSWAAALLMLLSLIPQFFSLSGDDLEFIVMPDPDLAIGRVYASGGRYLSALLFSAMQACHYDAMRDFPVMAAVYAIGFGFFAAAAVIYVWPASKSPLIPVAGAALFCFHGFQLDINSFKLQYAVSGLMYALMAGYLLAMSRQGARARRLVVAFLLLLLLNFTYQPATMALAWLVVAKSLVEVASAPEAGVAYRARVRAAVVHLAINAGLVLAAALSFIALSIPISRAIEIPLAKAYASLSPAALMDRLSQHLTVIGDLLLPVPTSLRYGLMNGGVLPLLWLVLVGALLVALVRSGKILAAALTAALVVLLLVLGQNPQNLAVANYWPTPRSSFYAGMITPVLAAAVAATLGAAGRRLVVAVVASALLFEISSTTRLLTDRYELMRRDIAIAMRIDMQIATSPELAGAKGIRLPAGPWRPYVHYFAGIPLTSFGSASLFGQPWAQTALLLYAGGLSLPRTGDSKCPEIEPDYIRPVTLRREGDDLVVCF